jgi:hypothetical protein
MVRPTTARLAAAFVPAHEPAQLSGHRFEGGILG